MAQTDPRKKKAQTRSYWRALILLSRRYPDDFRELRLAEKAHALSEDLDVNLPSGPSATLARRHIQAPQDELALPLTAEAAYDLLAFLQAALRRSSQLGISTGRRGTVAEITRQLSRLVNELVPIEQDSS